MSTAAEPRAAAQAHPAAAVAGLARPLVMRCGALGDMVLLTVLLKALHARFGTPVDLVTSGRWVPELLEGQASLGEVFLIGSRRTPFWLSPVQRSLARWLKERGPGPVWYCDRDAGRDLLRRGGIPDGHVCDSRLFPFPRGESFADRYLRLAVETPSAFSGRLPPPIADGDRDAGLVISPAARTRVAGWLAAQGFAGRDFIVVHPGCRHIARRHRLRSRSSMERYEKFWPVDRWAEVLRGVRARAPGQAILLTGTGPERGLNAQIIALAGLPDVHNVATQLSLPELVALLERTTSMISVDSGPAHVAGALRRPTVSLMGPTDGGLYRPGGATTPAVALTGHIEGHQNILGIMPETVVTAWHALTTGSVTARLARN
jgi:heptosyltransferase-2/heptosyltransferase-3